MAKMTFEEWIKTNWPQNQWDEWPELWQNRLKRCWNTATTVAQGSDPLNARKEYLRGEGKPLL